MEPGAGGGQSPRKPPRQLSQSLSLIDSIGYLLLATWSKAIWLHWVRPTSYFSQQSAAIRQLDATARPASKAAARRVWTAADKGNKLGGGDVG